MDGMLSQEEINALLGEMGASNNSSPADDNESLTPEEKDAIGEISNICMGTAATTLYSLVNQVVTITTPSVSICDWDDLASEYENPCVLINILYKEGISGNNMLILKEDDVRIITDLMMGGDGLNPSDELSELHFSAICEAMNQMMGSSATSLSSMLNKKIDISPPEAELVDINKVTNSKTMPKFTEGKFVCVKFSMAIGELVDSAIMQLYPIEFAKHLYSVFSSDEDSSATLASSAKATKQAAQKTETNPPVPDMGMMNQSMLNQGMMDMNQSMMNQGMMGMNQPMMNQGMMGMNQPMMNQGMMGMNQPMMNQGMMGMNQPMMNQGMMGMNQPNVNVQDVQFQAFSQGISPALQQENIDLIMDVPLDVSVVLGRTRKSIKEILGFSPGTIIELDKLAGEPIDVMVNQKLVAKGEVVVIEESFGIRITEIIK